MLIFEADPLKPFSDVVSIMNRFDDFAYIKCSPTMFSIPIPQAFPHSIVSLGMMTTCFNRYACDELHHLKFCIEDLFTTLEDLQGKGFSSLIFCLPDCGTHMVLEFRNPRYEFPRTKVLSTSEPPEEERMGRIDYGSFVAFDIKVFRRIVIGLNNVACASVTITNSKVKILAEDVMMVLTTERKHCIIGGVAPGEEIQTGMSLNPKEFYYSFTSKRLRLFRSFDPKGLMLIAPLELYAQIMSYFPSDAYVKN